MIDDKKEGRIYTNKVAVAPKKELAVLFDENSRLSFFALVVLYCCRLDDVACIHHSCVAYIRSAYSIGWHL